MAEPLANNDKITRKQNKFIKKVVETGNIRKSTALAGFSDPSYGSFLMRQPKIQTALQTELEKAGLGDKKVASEIKNGLKATYVKKDGGKLYPDFHARHKFLDTAIKIKGGYAPEKHEIEQKQLIIILSPELKRGLIDAKAMTEEESEVIEAEILEEEKINAKEI